MQNPAQSGSGNPLGQLGPLLEMLSKLKAPNGGIKGLAPVTPDHAFEATARMLMLILPVEIRIAGMIPRAHAEEGEIQETLEALIVKGAIFILQQQLGTDRMARIDPHLWELSIVEITRGLMRIKSMLAIQGPTG